MFTSGVEETLFPGNRHNRLYINDLSRLCEYRRIIRIFPAKIASVEKDVRARTKEGAAKTAF